MIRPPHSLPFLLTGLLLLSACGQDPELPEIRDGKDRDFSSGPVPIWIATLEGQARTAGPATFGVPLPRGEWTSADTLRVDWENGTSTAAFATPMTWWEDGSWSFARVEFLAPALVADERLEGVLKDDGMPPLATGSLNVQTASDGTLSKVGNDWFQIDPSSTTSLFNLGGSMVGPVTASLETDSETHPLATTVLHPARLEHQSNFAVRIRRDMDFMNAAGLRVASLTTRISLWRGHPAVRISQSLDVHFGTHTLRNWELLLPTQESGIQVARSGGNDLSYPAPCQLTQVGHDLWTDGSNPSPGKLLGLFGLGQNAIALEEFAFLFPNSVSLDSQGLHLGLGVDPGPSGRAEILLEGFGRTRETWLLANPAISSLKSLIAGVGFTAGGPDPDFAGLAEAYGPLRPHLLATDTQSPDFAVDAGIEGSVNKIIARRDKYPNYELGFRHFGDYTATLNSVSYWGAMQAEYDPPMVLLAQALRTANPNTRKLGLEGAWHYVDVDMAPWGGAFQHRATRHMVEVFIAQKLEVGLEMEMPGSSIQADPTQLLNWVSLQYEPDLALDMRKWLSEEQNRGTPISELRGRALSILSFNEVLIAESQASSSGNMDMEEFVRGIGANERIVALGFSDVDAQFAPFFAKHGGDWDNFPSFHVDPHPMTSQRHSGGHGLAQGMTLAYFATGEPRFRNTLLRFAQHHVDYIVPQALINLQSDFDRGKRLLFTRTVGWPLLNLATLRLFSEGAPGLAAMDQAILQAGRRCVVALSRVPPQQYKSTIHGGISMEALADWHASTGDPAALQALLGLAHFWVNNYYDAPSKSFRHNPGDSGPGRTSMSGLIVYGLSYATQYDNSPNLKAALLGAWSSMVNSDGYGKAFAMNFRGAPRCLERIQNLRDTNAATSRSGLGRTGGQASR